MGCGAFVYVMGGPGIRRAWRLMRMIVCSVIANCGIPDRISGMILIWAGQEWYWYGAEPCPFSDHS
jgi:hypothetical protein